MSEKREKADKNGIQVISRAAEILRSLKNAQSGMSLGQIAQRTGLPRSTVQRIAGALSDEGFLVTDLNRGGLRLGPELSALANAAQYSVADHCHNILIELTQQTGETTDLAEFRNDAMIFLDQVPGTHRLTTISSVGATFPLTDTANGKACLAHLPQDVAKSLTENEWSKSNKRKDMDKFLLELAKIKKTRLAYDLDEHTPGISAIGFAFTDWSSNLHAISVPVPSFRFAKQRHRIEAALLKAASEVTHAFNRKE